VSKESSTFITYQTTNKVMTKIIKQAAAKKQTYAIGQNITWTFYSNDGRVNSYEYIVGKITKVNRVTVNAVDKLGNEWNIDIKDICE
jgi:hypothetical protein